MLLEFLKITLVLIAVLFANLALGLAIKKTISYMETNPYGSRTLVYSVLYTSMVGHLYLYIARLPILFVFYSFSIQLILLWLYGEYPNMKVRDPRFIVATLGTILGHFVLTSIAMDMDVGAVAIITSYTIIWISPAMCFFSLSATDEILSFEAARRKSSRFLGSLVERVQGLLSRSDARD
jgi:hypothetical protein